MGVWHAAVAKGLNDDDGRHHELEVIARHGTAHDGQALVVSHSQRRSANLHEPDRRVYRHTRQEINRNRKCPTNRICTRRYCLVIRLAHYQVIIMIEACFVS